MAGLRHPPPSRRFGEKQSSFIDKYLPNEVILLLAASARDKMALTQRDGQEHSAAMSKSPISYWVCTIPYSMEDARGWFVKKYGSEDGRRFGLDPILPVELLTEDEKRVSGLA